MAKAEFEVYGRAYTVACSPGQESRLQSLAVELDQRVSAIASAVGDVGDDRLLLVAALSILDELDAARMSKPTSNGQSVSAAEARLADSLEKAAARIEALTARAESISR